MSYKERLLHCAKCHEMYLRLTQEEQEERLDLLAFYKGLFPQPTLNPILYMED